MEIQMQLIPAACGNCGYLYPSGYGFDLSGTGIDVSMTVFENAQVSAPCPMCGRHRGRVLANEYQFVRDAAKSLQDPEHAQEDLERLARFLRPLREERNESADGIRERAEGEAPGLSALVRELLDVKPARMDAATWTTLLVATLDGLTAARNNGSAARLEPGRVIYDSVNRYNVTTVQAPAAPDGPQPAVRKVGRNDPCPCGSGKKYKKCHGSPARASDAS